jgi:hypothetical protein
MDLDDLEDFIVKEKAKVEDEVEEKVLPKHTTWDIINSIFKKDFVPSPEEFNNLNSFMLCRTLSNHPLGIEVANIINNNSQLDIEMQYWLARSAIQSVKFIGFPKKDKVENENMKNVMKEYNCSEDVAKRYLKLLSEERIEALKTKYTHIGRTR